MIERTSAARRTSRTALPAWLAFMSIALALASWTLAGCGARPLPSPTPTKTSTPPPTATPSPAAVAVSQAQPNASSGDQQAGRSPGNATQAFPTPTRAAATPEPTATPVPTSSVSEATQILAERPDDVETLLSLMNASRASTRKALEAGSQNAEGTSTGATAQQAQPEAQTNQSETGSGTAINPLTGLAVSSARLNRRPLGIKVPNFPFEARPQSGLSRADVVIEHETEAYLARFTAIFLGNDAERVGPIRSLRLPDAEVMSIFRATLVASGGHPAVKIRITEGKAWAAGYRRIICPEAPFLGDGGALYRMPQLKSRYELTMYSDTASLWNVSAQRGINGRQDFHNMWVFDESPPAGGRAATHLKIVYKPTWSEAEYHYDSAIRAYRRYDVGQPTMDALTGQQIAPPNVLLLWVNHANSDILSDAHDPNNLYYAVLVQLWGKGSGRLMRDGQVYDIKWVRENPQQPNDRLLILDGQGQQIPFRPGPTWIQLVRPDAPVQLD